MERYHKEIFWPQVDADKLPSIVDRLNVKAWVLSQHSFDRIIEKSSKLGINLAEIGHFIKGLTLTSDNIFEFYKEDEAITKMVFRVPYGDSHLVLVVSDFKSLVTVYYNDKNDNHATLKAEQYTRKG